MERLTTVQKKSLHMCEYCGKPMAMVCTNSDELADDPAENFKMFKKRQSELILQRDKPGQMECPRKGTWVRKDEFLKYHH